MNQEFDFFDAHCHLQEPEISWDIKAIMERWRQNRGKTIVCCGTKESDWGTVGNIASQYSNVLPCFGIHPWFVENVSEKWFYELDRYLDMRFNCTKNYYDNDHAINYTMRNESQLKGFDIKTIKPFIGEIGLDNVIKNIDPVKQELIFKTQMGMARERKIPVSIHIRKGWDILIKILKKMGILEEGGLIHSYSGPADLIPILEKYGLYISFSGSVTNSLNKKVQKSLKAVSPQRLLIETDSPAILPKYYISSRLSEHPETISNIQNFIFSTKLFEMGWNEPCNIFLVAIAVSEILGITLYEVAHRTSMNGKELFLQ
ncbi:MAG: TatD family hydrolase [Desulfamplus sp.]|nr:TatD family hydrolase [Desulfamplus sp.]